MCIVKPLKVKAIFTPKRSAVVILVICGVLLLWIIIFTSSLGRQFSNGHQMVNSTELARLGKQKSVHFGVAASLQFFCVLVILISTIILALLVRRLPLPSVSASTPTEFTAVSESGNKASYRACKRFVPPVHHRPDAFERVKSDQLSLPPQRLARHIRPNECAPQTLNSRENARPLNDALPHPSTLGFTEHSTSVPAAPAALEEVFIVQNNGPTAIAVAAGRRKRRLALMVIAVSGVLLVSYLSSTIVIIAMIVEPQFRLVGR